MDEEINDKEIKVEDAPKETNMKVWAVVAVLGLLVVFSGFQALELANLKEKISIELTELTLASANEASDSTVTSADLQKNLDNLPDMVGGC